MAAPGPGCSHFGLDMDGNLMGDFNPGSLDPTFQKVLPPLSSEIYSELPFLLYPHCSVNDEQASWGLLSTYYLPSTD